MTEVVVKGEEEKEGENCISFDTPWRDGHSAEVI